MLGVPLDGRALAERIAAGDERAKACFRCFGEQLCDALQPQIEAFCPDTLCMGDRLWKARHYFCTRWKTLYKQEDYFIYYTGYFSADYAGADKSCQPVGIYQSAYISGKFQSMEHFKQELVEYLDYYNNRRIRAKRKGLPPAIHRQQALSAT